MATFSNRSNDKFYDVYIKCAFRLARDFVYYRSIREYVSRWNFLITRVVYRNSAVEKYVFPFRYIYVFIYIRVCVCVSVRCSIFPNIFLDWIEHVVAMIFLFTKHAYTMAYRDCHTYRDTHLRANNAVIFISRTMKNNFCHR